VRIMGGNQRTTLAITIRHESGPRNSGKSTQTGIILAQPIRRMKLAADQRSCNSHGHIGPRTCDSNNYNGLHRRMRNARGSRKHACSYYYEDDTAHPERPKQHGFCQGADRLALRVLVRKKSEILFSGSPLNLDR
jgi:hypothetical protein